VKLFIGKITPCESQEIQSLWVGAWHQDGARIDQGYLNQRSTSKIIGNVEYFTLRSDSGKIIGAARLTFHADSTKITKGHFFRDLLRDKGSFYFLDYCFITKEKQGQGLSRVLVRERIISIFENRPAPIYSVLAGKRRMKAFEKIGFVTVDQDCSYNERIFIHNNPFYLMVLNPKDVDLEKLKSYGPEIEIVR